MHSTSYRPTSVMPTCKVCSEPSALGRIIPKREMGDLALTSLKTIFMEIFQMSANLSLPNMYVKIVYFNGF